MRSLLLLLQGHAKVKNSESNDGYKKPLFKAVFYVLGGATFSISELFKVRVFSPE